MNSESTFIIMLFFLLAIVFSVIGVGMSLEHDCKLAAIAAKYPAAEIQVICK